jgi:endonuclease/exonuclease/phosphatase (EEP) superfamily protein YafD
LRRPISNSPAANFCRTLAVVGAIAAAIGLVAGMLGGYAWPLDLFAHFRVQYTLVFAIAALVLLILGRRLFAALSFAGALVSAVPIVPYVGLPSQSAEARSVDFRLVTFNVFFRNHDYQRIAKYLESTNADAIVLQEINKAQATQLQALLPSYPHAYLESSSRYGAAVFSRWPMTSAESLLLSPAGAQAAHVVLDWHGSAVAVLGVHLHWPLGPHNSQWRNAELARVAEFASSQQTALLVAGDFNITPWSTHFQDAVSRSGLIDCALGLGIEPSWPAPLPLLGIRIDHCLASKHWRSVDVSTGPFVGSDHRPLIADLQLLR